MLFINSYSKSFWENCSVHLQQLIFPSWGKLSKTTTYCYKKKICWIPKEKTKNICTFLKPNYFLSFWYLWHWYQIFLFLKIVSCNCSHVSTVALGVSVGPLGYTGSDWNILTAFGWIARIHLHGSQKMNPVDFIEALPFLVCCHEVEILGQEWNVFTPIARSAIAFGKTIHDPFRMNCHNFGDHLHISSSAIVRQTFWLTSTLWPNHYYK